MTFTFNLVKEHLTYHGSIPTAGATNVASANKNKIVNDVL